jgi:hypothetical protein
MEPKRPGPSLRKRRGMQSKGRPSFSVHEFKNWMAQQPNMSDFFDLKMEQNDADNELVGREVGAKVSLNKLIQKIHTDEGDVEELAADLAENGGIILDVEEKNLLVEVDSGCFYIPRFCVKLRKSNSA